MSCKFAYSRQGTFLTLESRAAYSGTALAFRDELIIEWNKTQQRQTFVDQKRVYCKAIYDLG